MPERRSLNPAPRPERVAVDAELTRDLHLALVATRAESYLFDEQVALKNGVERETLKRWLAMGVAENAREPYVSFARDYSQASIECEETALEEIRDARQGKGERDWKATAWWLERWRPLRWGSKVPAGGPRESIDVQLLVEQNEQRKTTIAELFDEPPPELEAAMLEKRDKILALLGVTPKLGSGES
jgi:hypothetical protein